jgi:hypothetical protein
MDDWVAHFVEEERHRERVQSREAASVAQQAENNVAHVRTLMDLLRARLLGDAEAFAKAFPDRKISQEDHPGGALTVRRGHYPEVRLTVEPNPNAGTITVDYVFTSQSGVLTPKPMVLELAGDPAGRPDFRDDAGQHAFRTIAQLSEHLLVPVFTGRPR